jgi:hypothetical protein
LLAYAGMIRAFPGIAVLGLLVPPLWWVVDVLLADRELPSLRETLREHEGTVRALLAAAAAVAIMVVLSSAVLSPSAWIGWAKKTLVLTSGYHVNHVNFPSIVWTDYETWDMVPFSWRYIPRFAPHLIGVIAFSVLILRAGRNRAPHQAALISLFLIPVVLNAANYYFHYVFLLPLLAVADGEDRHDVRVWAPLLAMCVAEYAATVAPALSQHFVTESICLMATLLVILVGLNREPEARGEVVEAEAETQTDSNTEAVPAMR